MLKSLALQVNTIKGCPIPSQNYSLEQLEHKNEGVNVSESYAMHLVFLCVVEVCSALDVLILDRISKKTKDDVTNSADYEVTDVKHHDKTGLGSESWKHSQPLDVETEGKSQ